MPASDLVLFSSHYPVFPSLYRKTLSNTHIMRTAITTLLALAAASTVQAHPHSSGCTSTAAAGPAATTDANANAKTKLLQDLQLATTDLDRARLLLLNGETLRTGDDLKEVIVFDFNDLQPASGATGGASKTAVSIAPTLHMARKS
jgi:hypothetical protein